MELTTETLKESPDVDICIFSNEWEIVSLDIVKNHNKINSARCIVYRDENNQLIKTHEII